jgi:hypothetical protein
VADSNNPQALPVTPLTFEQQQFAYNDPVMKEALTQVSRQSPNAPNISGNPLPSDPLDMFQGLTQSFFQGMGPSLVGVEPSKELQDFHAQHPISAGVAELTGSLLPYSLPVRFESLGLGLAEKIPGLARLVKAAEVADTAGQAGKAAFMREVARFAPLEGTRVAVATVLGHGPQAAGEAVFNLSLAGGFSAGFAKLSRNMPAMGPEFKPEGRISEFVPEYDLLGSAQSRLAQVLDIEHNKPQDILNELEVSINQVKPQLAKAILEDDPARRIASVLEGEQGEPNARKLSGLFGTLGESGGKTVNKFIAGSGPGLIKDPEALTEALGRAGISDATLHNVQYPRLLTTQSPETREKVISTLNGALERVGPGEWLGRENNGGLYVVAKRIRNLEKPKVTAELMAEAKAKGPQVLQKSSSGDQYVFFKTDRPDKFLRNASVPTENLQKLFGPLGRTVNLIGGPTGPIGTFVNGLALTYPRGSNFKGVSESNLAEIFGRAFARLSPALQEPGENIGRNIGNLVGQQVQNAKNFFAPIISRFSENMFALRIAMMSKSAFAHATKLAEQEFSGRHVFADTVMKDIIRGETAAKGSPRNLIYRIWHDPGDAVLRAKQINLAIAANMDEAQMVKEGFDPTVRALAGALNKLDLRKTSEIIATQFATDGEATLRPLANHFMVSRQWRGNFRVAVFEEGDPSRIIGYGSGRNKQDALAEADALISEVNSGVQDGAVKVTRDKSSNAVFNTHGSRDRDFELMGTLHSTETAAKFNNAKAFATREPRRFAERYGMKGYNADLTEEELASSIRGNLLESNRYMAERHIRHVLAPDFDMVGKTGRSSLLSELNRTIAGFRGASQYAEVRTGPGGTGAEIKPTGAFPDLDKAVNSVIEPIFGFSASQVSQALKAGMFHLTLGAMDMGFAALNALTPVTNVLPEIAFTLGASPEKLGKFYSWHLVQTRNGLRPVGVFEPLKILTEAYKNVGTGTGETLEFYKRLVKNGVLDRGILDEVVGPNSGIRQQLSAALKGEQGFVKFLRNASVFAADRSERFSRAVTGEAARIVGQEVFGLKGRSLEQFAGEMIGRTMYGYTAGDRPRVLTGAIGSFFGLFKNFTAHYISNMLTYTGEAFRAGNIAPLAWTFGSLGALGGVGAMPGVGAADSLSKHFTNKSLQENINTAFGLSDTQLPGTDTLFYGLPALADVSLQGRAAAPGASFLRDVNMLFSSAILERAGYLGKAIGATLNDPLATILNHPIKSGQVRDLWARALAPRSLYRALQITNDGQMRSLQTGNMIMDNISQPKRIAFSMGATPLDIEKNYAIQNQLWEDQAKTKALIGDYGEALALAWQRKDYPAVNALWREVYENGVPMGSVSSSMVTRMRNETEPLMDRQFDLLKKSRMERAFQVQ